MGQSDFLVPTYPHCRDAVSLWHIAAAVESLRSKLTSAAKSNLRRVSLATGAEPPNYPPLEFILNACIESSVEVIEKRSTTLY